jgi:hypothetical protein
MTRAKGDVFLFLVNDVCTVLGEGASYTILVIRLS